MELLDFLNKCTDFSAFRARFSAMILSEKGVTRCEFLRFLDVVVFRYFSRKLDYWLKNHIGAGRISMKIGCGTKNLVTTPCAWNN